MNNLEETGLTELNSTELKETEGGSITVAYIPQTGEMVVAGRGVLMVVSDKGVRFI